MPNTRNKLKQAPAIEPISILEDSSGSEDQPTQIDINSPQNTPVIGLCRQNCLIPSGSLSLGEISQQVAVEEDSRSN
jgi:hypothetical protein